MKIIRIVSILLLAIIGISWFASTGTWKRTKAIYLPKNHITRALPVLSTKKIGEKAIEAKEFVKKNGYNESTCFLIDMSLPSGQNRFFVYDLVKDTLQNAGLVAHGNCFQTWLEGRKYNNTVGGGCTSLGKYKIGAHYTGKFGYSYKLHGLEETNDNAFERTVVLHSHSCVPENEITGEICQSNGCPTVNPVFLETLKEIINSSSKPVLLWIYE